MAGDSFSNVSRKADASPSQTEGGAWGGISRELLMFGTAASEGAGGGLEHVRQHPLQFCGDLLAPIGLSIAARGPKELAGVAATAGLVGTAFYIKELGHALANSWDALADAHHNSDNIEADRKFVSKQLGPAVFDTLVMGAVGLAALRLAPELYGLKTFPVAGSAEPQRLPSAKLARAFEFAQPSMVRIEGAPLPGSNAIARGSGWIAREDGYVFTSLHNIDPQFASRYDIYLPNGEKRSWRLYAKDERNDIALLELAKNSPDEIFSALRLDQKLLKPGAEVVGAGFRPSTVLEATPGKFDGQTTLGPEFDTKHTGLDEKSVFGAELQPGAQRNVFFGAFEPGQSGGPLLNKSGQVVGLMTNRIDMPKGADVDVLGMAAQATYLRKMLSTIST